ncbi:right-handed parallel beta-helix repeat-containing protein [Alloacidobacterium dinghuense]|uniref:Right-handed parallel beta-helix repeat-containing protein n=1 Tax=Alloacidobacterium dinghuense TaxID=2763107 RepID=A0A7G8BDZ8_9BACT|nr:right-handed parallel beta-helix repeat-containing protein [Alloacidobacterium dinghuense]QNI30768.1 right-handed parallel beta-helix repeat-containing protein [Alloacidobacterium dinghuense]
MPAAKPVSIAQFGAKGDARTDDTKAFIAAINAGGNIQLDGKTYLLTSALQIPHSLSITSTAKSTLLFRSATPLEAAFIINDQSNVLLSGFMIQGAGSSLAHGIEITNSQNIHLDRLQIDGIRGTLPISTAGIVLNSVDGVWITNSTFTDIGSDSQKTSLAIWNYYKKRSEHVYVDHNQIHNNVANIAIGLFDTENSIVSNNVIDQGNTCVNPCRNNGYGILFYLVDHSKPDLTDDSALNNQVSNTAGSAIYFVAVNNVHVEGNVVSNSTQKMDDASLPAAAIALNGTDTGEIKGNIIQSDHKGGICLATTKNVTIEENQIHNAGAWGVHLRVAQSHTLIRNNTIDGAPTAVLEEKDATDTKIENNAENRVMQAHVKHQ